MAFNLGDIIEGGANFVQNAGEFVGGNLQNAQNAQEAAILRIQQNTEAQRLKTQAEIENKQAQMELVKQAVTFILILLGFITLTAVALRVIPAIKAKPK